MRKAIKNAQDIPQNGHYAVIISRQERITIPGDERSRQCPGHGYPEHTETYNLLDYYAYDYNDAGYKQFEQHVAELFKEKPNRTDVRLLEVKGAMRPVITVSVK